MGKFTERLNERIQLVDKTHYKRERLETYMTAPEWRNVEMSEEYADFLKDGHSMFQFPYFRQIVDLWIIFYHSYHESRKYHGFFQVLMSEYILQNIFISLFTTVELLPKACLALLLYPFLNTENPSEMQQNLADHYKNYTEKLQTIPFYEHDYKTTREALAAKYETCKNTTWVDWFSWTVTSLELRARRWISKPLEYWFHQEGNTVFRTTDILVKLNTENVDSPEEAKALFKSKMAKLNPENHVAIVKDDLYIKTKSANKTHTSVYARLSVPRYKEFIPVLAELANQGIIVKKIAGQDKVQIKCFSQSSETVAQQKLPTNIEHLYSYGDHIHANRKICLFDAPVKNLHQTVAQLNETKDLTVEFIHNF